MFSWALGEMTNPRLKTIGGKELLGCPRKGCGVDSPMRYLVWPLLILMWIALLPIYAGAFLWMSITGKRIAFEGRS